MLVSIYFYIIYFYIIIYYLLYSHVQTSLVLDGIAFNVLPVSIFDHLLKFQTFYALTRHFFVEVQRILKNAGRSDSTRALHAHDLWGRRQNRLGTVETFRVRNHNHGNLSLISS
jgi:hypothetical protein